MGCVQSSQEIDATENQNQSGQNVLNNRGQDNSAQRSNQQFRGRQLNQNQAQSAAANPNSNRRNGGQAAAQISQSQRIQYLQNQNVETIVPGKFTGQGIKKTPAYETPLSKHELDKWRKDFWDTRTSGSRHIWNCIKSSCEETFDTAEALILAADLQMPQNSLTLCIDETGVYYRVPICLINDPINYDADFQTQKLKNKSAPAEFQMTLKIRHATVGDTTLNFSNLLAIEAFKQLYIDSIKEKQEVEDISKIRMFAMGKELKNELFIYSYDIMNESTVQVMITKPVPK